MLFADDSYVFCRANTREADSIMELLHLYEQASGQRVNFEKSSVFFSSNTEASVRDFLCGQLGIYEADDNITYLGLPNIMGRKKTTILGFLKDKLQKRIQGWEGRLLSRAGKEVLLKTVAQAIPNYAMSVFLLPVETSKELEGIMAKFWWRTGYSNTRNISWMSWGCMCRHKHAGRLGFRSLHDFNLSLLGKQGWQLLTNESSLIGKVFKARYYPNKTFLDASLGNNPSFVWRSVHEAHAIVRGVLEGRWEMVLRSQFYMILGYLAL
ncbi:uncharacterized protein LOC115710395 [Cannabis sativa]|uniref:uncharacterized protein LOC115710395 n=1 Tax=Cannabis sativa TaxID=3483 RepID=UPI0029CA8333|nr:uncharacterized protein LOC115710395 [Cannabis sativa]